MEQRHEITNVVSQSYFVLHIDSDMFTRRIFNKTFSGELFNLDSAADGKEAFLFLEQKQYAYDIVITEMHMHFANGYEIVNRIRQEAPHCTVIITSNMSFLYIREGLDLDWENYFKKPLVVGKLINRIKTILLPEENAGYDNPYELSSPATQLLASIFDSDVFSNDRAKILKNGGGTIVEPLVASFSNPFIEDYPANGSATPTDGILGGTDYSYNWLLFAEGMVMIDIPIGRDILLASIQTDFLFDRSHYLFLPEKISAEESIDGNNYFPIGSQRLDTNVPSDMKARVQTWNAR